jgi:hypothetical protein
MMFPQLRKPDIEGCSSLANDNIAPKRAESHFAAHQCVRKSGCMPVCPEYARPPVGSRVGAQLFVLLDSTKTGRLDVAFQSFEMPR